MAYYDYDQHLKPIGAGGGKFVGEDAAVAAESSLAAKARTEEAVALAELDPDVLALLESDSELAGDYEKMPDDFVAQGAAAADGALPELAW